MIHLANKTGNKAIAIHQPNYIPWLGYFFKIFQSDIFVFLDDVQYSNQGMHNFHYVKTPQGTFRLKIPVKQKLGDKIMDVETRDELNWKKKHIKTFENFYRKARFFNEVYTDYENLILIDYLNIVEMNIAIIQFMAKKMGFDTMFYKSSELNIQTPKEEKILNICKALGGKIYYSGIGAKAYQNEEHFTDQGIELRYSIFNPFEYPQLWGDFQPNVTIIDYLMNCGYNWENVMKYQN